MIIYICGRKVRVVTGQPGREDKAKSQTVNTCTAANRVGKYDYVVRLRPPHFTSATELEHRDFGSIEDLVGYLRKQHFGELEKAPKGEGLTIQPPREPPIRISDSHPWEETATSIVERAIDQCVLEFIEFPYLHRVESSIHCELYQLLSNQRTLAGVYPMNKWSSQLIHKEWPEYKPRPDKLNRRGNIDLCILSPEQLKACSLKNFREGRIKPIIAIEIGLDCGLDHLKQDSRKLRNSAIANGYLIHLVRQDFQDDFAAVEQFLVSDSLNLKTAYARLTGSGAIYKLTNDVRLSAKRGRPKRGRESF